MKNNLYKQYLANNEKYEEEIREKYNIDNLFKNKNEEKEIKQENLALETYKESIIKRIINKIKKFFKR